MVQMAGSNEWGSDGLEISVIRGSFDVVLYLNPSSQLLSLLKTRDLRIDKNVC